MSFPVGPAAFQRRGLPIKNTESHVIPPFGAMEIADADYDEDTGEIVFEVKRPTADSIRNVIFNTFSQIGPKGSDSGCGTGTMDFPCLAARGTSGSDVGAVNDKFGTQKDKYTLKKGKVGFSVIKDIAKKNAICIRHDWGSRRFLAWVAGSAIPKATGTAPGSLTPGSRTLDIYNSTDFSVAQTGATVKNWTFNDSGTSRFVYVDEDEFGTFLYIAEACP